MNVLFIKINVFLKWFQKSLIISCIIKLQYATHKFLEAMVPYIAVLSITRLSCGDIIDIFSPVFISDIIWFTWPSCSCHGDIFWTRFSCSPLRHVHVSLAVFLIKVLLVTVMLLPSKQSSSTMTINSSSVFMEATPHYSQNDIQSVNGPTVCVLLVQSFFMINWCGLSVIMWHGLCTVCPITFEIHGYTW